MPAKLARTCLYAINRTLYLRRGTYGENLRRIHYFALQDAFPRNFAIFILEICATFLHFRCRANFILSETYNYYCRSICPLLMIKIKRDLDA